jgi:hypothetical protein
VGSADMGILAQIAPRGPERVNDFETVQFGIYA